MLVAESGFHVDFLGKCVSIFCKSGDSVLSGLAVNRRNVSFSITDSFVGAVGVRSFAAKVDMSAKERVSENEFLSRQLIENVVGNCKIALFRIFARFAVVSDFGFGIVNKIRVEINRKTTDVAAVIEVEFVLVIVWLFGVYVSAQLVVIFIVAKYINGVPRLVVAVENFVVGIFCANRVFIVNLIVNTKINRCIVVSLVLV